MVGLERGASGEDESPLLSNTTSLLSNYLDQSLSASPSGTEDGVASLAPLLSLLVLGTTSTMGPTAGPPPCPLAQPTYQRDAAIK